MQGLQDMYETYADQGFVVISVVVQDLSGDTPTTEDAALWQDELDLSFVVLADVDGEVFPVWDPEGVLPVTGVVDAEGVVRWRKAGGSDAELEEIEATVVGALP